MRHRRFGSVDVREGPPQRVTTITVGEDSRAFAGPRKKRNKSLSVLRIHSAIERGRT